RDVDLEIGPRTVLVGPMSTGKTTVLDAMRFLAVGYVPRLGRQGKATSRLIRHGEREMEVSWRDNHRMFSRSIQRVGQKSTKADAMASWVPPETTPTAHHEEIVRQFGPNEEAAAEAVDIRELINASPAHRAQRIQALLDKTGLTEERARALMGALM